MQSIKPLSLKDLQIFGKKLRKHENKPVNGYYILTKEGFERGLECGRRINKLVESSLLGK